MLLLNILVFYSDVGKTDDSSRIITIATNKVTTSAVSAASSVSPSQTTCCSEGKWDFCLIIYCHVL